VHWCGRRVRFNEFPTRFPIRSNRVAQRFRRRIREALVQSRRDRSGSTGFRRRFRRRFQGAKPSQVQLGKVPEKVMGGFGAEPGEVQHGSGEGSGESSGEGSGEGRGGFVAEPGQVQHGSGEGSVEGLGGLVQSQVRFNRVPEKVWEALV